MKSYFNFMQTIKVIALALVLAFGVQYAVAQTWVGPSGSPPGNNTPAPLNVGSLGQIKTGGVTLGSGLTAAGVALNVPNGKVMLKLPTPPTVGQVLTAQDTSGTLGWTTPAAGGGGGTNNNFYNNGALVSSFQNVNALSGGGLVFSNTGPAGGQWTSMAIDFPYRLPINCSIGQVPKMTGPTTWSCANDNGGTVSVSTSCNYVYGNGNSTDRIDGVLPLGGELTCPSNQVQTGVRLIDTNSGCNMSSSDPTCGARVVAIKCCPIN